MSVTCNSCGDTWPRDPVLEVRCPVCQAPIGKACTRPSGHGVWNYVDGLKVKFHIERDQAALDAGIIRKCSGVRNGTDDGETSVKVSERPALRDAIQSPPQLELVTADGWRVDDELGGLKP